MQDDVDYVAVTDTRRCESVGDLPEPYLEVKVIVRTRGLDIGGEAWNPWFGTERWGLSRLRVFLAADVTVVPYVCEDGGARSVRGAGLLGWGKDGCEGDI